MQTTIETARLLLRKPQRSDIPALVPLIGNYAVARNLSRVPHPYDNTDARRWIAELDGEWQRGGDYAFALIRKDDGAFLGVCGVHPARDFELGYWVGEPYWRQGYATEAARAVARFAFDEFNPAKLFARYMQDNPASGRVLTKLGFVYTHDEPCPALARGGEAPGHCMALTRERFDSMNETP